MPRGCRICNFWKKYPYRVSDKLFFETKARQNTSLSKLSLLLESYGCSAKKDLINRHLKECLGFDVERKIEREIKKGNLGQKLRRKASAFFIPRKEKPTFPKSCPHLQTLPVFDLDKERVFARCKACGEILRGSAKPHQRRTSRNKNLVVLDALRRRRR